jgi:glycosyltransferase involved in cell wall biosynthesis
MRVLYLTGNPNLGSTTRTLQAWLVSEPGQGVDPFVCAQKEGPFARWLQANRIPHQINPMPWFDRRHPVKTFGAALRLARWARQQRIDVVHCNEHDTYPFGVMVARLLRRPIVCHIRFRVEEGFCRWAFKPGRQPDAVLWTSHQQKADSSAAIAGTVPEDRQHVIHLGLDFSTFGAASQTRADTRRQWGVSADTIVIGSATALRPRKRIEDFVELVRRAAERSPRVVGVLAGDIVAGDEAYLEKLNAQIAASGLGRRLVRLGNIDDVEPFYHAIDLFVSTSDYETFGMSVLEAMACRKAVAAYTGGSVHEVLGDAGIIVETGDLEGLSRATEALVGDAVERERIGRLGRQRAEQRFDATRSVNTLLSLYASLGSRGSAS